MLKDIVCRWVKKAKNDLEIAEIILGKDFIVNQPFIANKQRRRR